ncbi:MAG: C1 family peptidase [Verrucomicrobia bacterium]|nr:C1 family peptidase [Verrucomicrobiota bacterium]
MIFRISCFALALFSVSLTTTLRADDAPAKIAAGTQLASLKVGPTVYTNVLIRSVTARSAMVTYDGGMKSILLRDLSPELQQRFGYNAEADRAQEATAKAGHAAAEKQQQARLETLRKNRAAAYSSVQSISKIDQLLRSFGQAPEIAEEVDLRPRFNELGLWVKDQGHRPSCSVFAIVSALEFQNAETNGNTERFSEEYLYWATSKSLNRQPPDALFGTGDGSENQSDVGFSLVEVATALRTYGIPLQDKVPNLYAGKVMASPPTEIIEEARISGRTSVHAIPGHSGGTLATNIIHALNLGIPVPVGIRWPDTRVWRIQFLDSQRVDMRYSHAVTIVGYRCKSGKIEDTVFLFKNSWGPRWGQGGYGTASFGYLSKNLHSAVVLEMQPKSK